MDKIKLIKEIEHIALTYEFDNSCPHTRDFSREL